MYLLGINIFDFTQTMIMTYNTYNCVGSCKNPRCVFNENNSSRYTEPEMWFK